MKVNRTARGFDLILFDDNNNQKCSLQKSSSALEDKIWLGVDVDLEGKKVSSRMHLTIDQVKELLPHLQSFVETGEIRLTKQIQRKIKIEKLEE